MTTLFIVTLLVLMLLGGAFHWQAAQGGGGRRHARRCHGAPRQGPRPRPVRHVGLGRRQWHDLLVALDVRHPRHAGEGRLSQLREVASRLHPEDTQLEDAVESLLRGRASRPSTRNSACATRTATGSGSGPAPPLQPGDKAGEPHLIGIVFDITQQKHADKLNKEAELRLMDAVENISEAFVLWDADNRLVLCNSKYQQFHSLPASVCVPGTPYEDVVRIGQGTGDPQAHRPDQARCCGGPFLRGAAGRPALAADQRAPHQGWRLRLGRHRHHRAEEARRSACCCPSAN